MAEENNIEFRSKLIFYMKKRVLFDLKATQPIGNIKFHGGGKYGIAVFKKLAEIAPKNIAVFYDANLYLDDEVAELIKVNSMPSYKLGDIDIVEAAHQESDVIYTPLYGAKLTTLSCNNTILLTTIHGLRALEMPEDKYEKYYIDKGSVRTTPIKLLKDYLNIIPCVRKYKYKRSLRKEQDKLKDDNLHFITVSEHSKYSLLAFMPFLKPNDIKVFYSPSTINHEPTIVDFKNEYGKFYLIVSGNRWVKNGIRAIIALDQLFSEHPEIKGKVVVTGLKTSNDIAIKITNRERFIFKGYVDETTLKVLYHNAYALIYPSLNEGFGYPPLEAMYEGCPVIASAITSIPEICADAVLYFNPYLISEIKMRVLQMEEENTHRIYAERGKQRQQLIEKRQEEDLINLCHYILSYLNI